MALFDREQIEAALPGYEIGEVLGRGSSGVVVAARHRHISRGAAVKVLAAAEYADRAGFRREADVLAGLDHPHIVRIYDYVERDDLSLLVMESLPGNTLAARLMPPQPSGTGPGAGAGLGAGGGLGAAEACALVLAAADALAAAHRAGVLHRDVKPTNMIFASDGALKLVDFGISKFFRATGTSVTTIAGTPGYMAPEQLGGGHLGPGTDLYGLGVVLFRLLTGVLPFDPLLPPMRLWQQQLAAPVDVPASVPPPLAAVLSRALARDLADRFPNAQEFAVALADAARTLFGPDWLEHSGAVVRVDRPPVASAEPRTRSAEPRTRSAEPRTRSAEPVDLAGPTVPATQMTQVRPVLEGTHGTGGLRIVAAPTAPPRVPPAPAPHPAEAVPRPAETSAKAATGTAPGTPPGAARAGTRGAGTGEAWTDQADGGEVLVAEPAGGGFGPGTRAGRAVVLAAAVLIVVVTATLLAVLGGDQDDPGPSGPAGGGERTTEPVNADVPVAGALRLRGQALPDAASARVAGLASSPGRVRVAVGSRGTGDGTTPVAWRSVDGAAWTSVPVAAAGRGEMAAVTFAPGQGFVAVGSADAAGTGPMAALWTSVDGASWAPSPADRPAPGAPTVRALDEVVAVGGALLVVGRSTDALERDHFWRSTDGGATWLPLPATGLDGPAEQHVSRIVETAPGRLLGAGTEPEGGTAVTRLRWSAGPSVGGTDGGTDWRLADSRLPRGLLARDLAVLADGRVIAVGVRRTAADGLVPRVAVSDMAFTRWDEYTVSPDPAGSAAAGSGAVVNLLGGWLADGELLLFGDVTAGGSAAGEAAMWSVEPPL